MNPLAMYLIDPITSTVILLFNRFINFFIYLFKGEGSVTDKSTDIDTVIMRRL